jgi:hypothetical protein
MLPSLAILITLIHVIDVLLSDLNHAWQLIHAIPTNHNRITVIEARAVKANERVTMLIEVLPSRNVIHPRGRYPSDVKGFDDVQLGRRVMAETVETLGHSKVESANAKTHGSGAMGCTTFIGEFESITAFSIGSMHTARALIQRNQIFHDAAPCLIDMKIVSIFAYFVNRQAVILMPQ